MSQRFGGLARPLIFAALLGLVVVIAYGIAVATPLGWLGVGLIGLALTLVSVRLDMHDDNAIPGGHMDKGSVDMLVRQLRAREVSGPRPEPNRDGIYLTRGIGLLLSVLGLGLFVLQNF